MNLFLFDVSKSNSAGWKGSASASSGGQFLIMGLNYITGPKNPEVGLCYCHLRWNHGSGGQKNR